MLMGYDEYQRKAAEEFRRVDGLYLEDNITRMALIYNLHARGKHYATIWYMNTCDGNQEQMMRPKDHWERIRDVSMPSM